MSSFSLAAEYCLLPLWALKTLSLNFEPSPWKEKRKIWWQVHYYCLYKKQIRQNPRQKTKKKLFFTTIPSLSNSCILNRLIFFSPFISPVTHSRKFITTSLFLFYNPSRQWPEYHFYQIHHYCFKIFFYNMLKCFVQNRVLFFCMSIRHNIPFFPAHFIVKCEETNHFFFPSSRSSIF